MYFLQDFYTSFPTQKLTKKPKIEKIIISTNLNNRKFSNIYKSGSSAMDFHLLERYFLFKQFFLQSPTIIKGTKSVANWNIRKGMDNGILVTIRSSNPFYFDFILNLYPQIVQYDIQPSFINNRASDFGLSSLMFFPIKLEGNTEETTNRIKNDIENIGLRFHITTSLDHLSQHKFILNYNKFY